MSSKKYKNFDPNRETQYSDYNYNKSGKIIDPTDTSQMVNGKDFATNSLNVGSYPLNSLTKLPTATNSSTTQNTSFWAPLQNLDAKLNNAFYNSKFMKSGLGKFINRIGQSGAEIIGANVGDKNFKEDSTGNKAADTIANIAGAGMGLIFNPIGGVNAAANKMLTPVGDIAEKGANNLVGKIGQSAFKNASNPTTYNVITKAASYLPTMARAGAEQGLQGAGIELANGGNVKDIAKEGLVNAGQGALFGGALKSLGDLGHSAFKTNVTIDRQQLNNPRNVLKPLDINTPLSENNLLNNEVASTKTLNNSKGFDKNTFTKLSDKKVEQMNNLDNKLKSNASINELQADNPKIVSSGKDKTTLGQKFNNLYTSLIDRNKPIADFSKTANDKTYTLATNSANTKNIADYIMTDNLVDRQGNVIGKSLKETLKNIPKNQENDFMQYALEKHNIARAKEGKPVFPNHTSIQSAEIVKKIEAQHPEWVGQSKNINTWINKFMNEWGVNAGTLDKGLYEANLKTYPNYIPTNRDFSTLEQTGQGYGGSKGFVNNTTPLKRATGSTRDIIDPRENIANLVNRVVKTAKNNEVGQSLADTIRNNPGGMKKYAEIVGEPKGNVKNVVRVLENGQPTYVQINDLGLLKAMENLNKTDVGGLEAGAKKFTNVYKSLITQKNPVFAVRNIARDIPTAYVNGSEGNPLKFTKNLLSAGKDVITNSEDFQKYKALGGGGSNFFDSNNPAKSVKELTNNLGPFKRALSAIPNGIEKFNNITESAPRLAEFKNVLQKTGDVDKAMFAANEITTNFSRGGDIAKHADSFVPYLNAGLQGIDKEVRQLKNNPVGTIAKGIAGITVPTLAFDYMNKDNENYKNLDNRTKDNYFLIPNGDTFIKIPKSRELGVLFGSLAERVLRAKNGEQNAFKGFGNTVATNFAPSNPIENNLISPLAYNIPSNKDFAGRTIVPQSMIQDNRSPYLQYDEKTSEIGKKIGELTGLSPKQVDYVIRSYTGVLGQMGLPAATKSNYTGDNNLLDVISKPVTTQFVSDPNYSNQALTDFYDNYNKVQRKATDNNIINNIPSKTLTSDEVMKSKFTKASQQISDINKRIAKTNDPETIKILRQQIIDIANNYNKMLK